MAETVLTDPLGAAREGVVNVVRGTAGMGVAAVYDAAVTLTDFEIADAALCGVQVSADGEIDLNRGLVRGCTISACVETEGYDIARLSRAVGYLDNGTNLQTVTPPVPETQTPTEVDPSAP